MGRSRDSYKGLTLYGNIMSSVGVPSLRRIYLTKAKKRAAKRVRRSNLRASMFAKKECRKIVNCVAEKKYFTNSPGPADVTNSGVVTCISLIPQGDTDSTRDGDGLVLRSIEINWEALSSPGTGTSLVDCVRFIVFQWFPNSVPAAGSVLLNAGSTSSHLSPWNHDQRFNFRILYDKRYDVTKANANPQINSNSKVTSPRILITKGFKYHIQYQSGTTVGSNLIYVLAITDTGGTAGNVPQYNFYSKINYTDA